MTEIVIQGIGGRMGHVLCSHSGRTAVWWPVLI